MTNTSSQLQLYSIYVLNDLKRFNNNDSKSAYNYNGGGYNSGEMTIPLLVVGTKFDQAQIVRNSSSLKTSSPIASELNADEINLVY